MSDIERPILFQAEMIRAILADRKTATRRIVRICNDAITKKEWDAGKRQRGIPSNAQNVRMLGYLKCDAPPGSHAVSSRVESPYGLGGDLLWCRETFALAPACNDPDPEVETDWHVIYRADQDPRYERPWTDESGEATVKPPWKPSIFMPRWASRLTLRVLDVSVQRLHEIDDDDARREGVADRAAFEALWIEINGRKSWQADPFVWVVRFERIPQRARAT